MQWYFGIFLLGLLRWQEIKGQKCTLLFIFIMRLNHEYDDDAIGIAGGAHE